MVTIALAFTAHLCNRKQMSTQHFPTLLLNTKTNSSEPHNKQVIFNSALFMMLDTKTVHCWQHKLPQEATAKVAHTCTQANARENQLSIQRGPTPRNGLRLQNWRLTRWSNTIQDNQPPRTRTAAGLGNSEEQRRLPTLL